MRKEHDERRRNARRGRDNSGDACHVPPRLPSRHLLTKDAIDPTEQEQLALARGATTHMGEQIRAVTVVEQVRQPLPRLFVLHGDSSPSSVASRLRPRRFQLLTEPSGTRSRLAIALSLRSL